MAIRVEPPAAASQIACPLHVCSPGFLIWAAEFTRPVTSRCFPIQSITSRRCGGSLVCRAPTGPLGGCARGLAACTGSLCRSTEVFFFHFTRGQNIAFRVSTGCQTGSFFNLFLEIAFFGKGSEQERAENKRDAGSVERVAAAELSSSRCQPGRARGELGGEMGGGGGLEHLNIKRKQNKDSLSVRCDVRG